MHPVFLIWRIDKYAVLQERNINILPSKHWGLSAFRTLTDQWGACIGSKSLKCKMIMADSCQYMAKTLQYCKVISLQLIKINGKK